MPEELSVPITSRESIRNGGKEGDLTIQSEPGRARKALRQLETAFNEYLSANQRTEAFGEQASSRETIFRTRRSGGVGRFVSIRFSSSTSPEPPPPSASSPTIREENVGKVNPSFSYGSIKNRR